MADWTKRDQATNTALAERGRRSVPVYVLWKPGWPQERLLPQVLDESTVLAALESAVVHPVSDGAAISARVDLLQNVALLCQHPPYGSGMVNTLFSQGPIGPFFAGLAKELQRRGDTVRHVVFNGGDRLFADRSARIDYTGRPEDVGLWILAKCREWQVDRVILFGDCRPYHRAIHQLLNEAHVPVWVFEEGYLRPFFLTFERHGVNAHTLLPRDPSFYLDGPEAAVDAIEKPCAAFIVFSARASLPALAYYVPWHCATRAIAITSTIAVMA